MKSFGFVDGEPLPRGNHYRGYLEGRAKLLTSNQLFATLKWRGIVSAKAVATPIIHIIIANHL